ncbi:MAG: sulfurtransferase TusA family protein [Candidatus Methanofastidiosa archaeon]|jgi:TusA-related sulfurtransferase|nr:sulfurtransferase TusA family protein [Candidatus Methanofastidiosa archaeon]
MTSVTVDATGVFCPEPIVRLGKAIRALESGDTVLLLADDPTSRIDIPNWAETSGNELISVTEEDDHVVFLIKKR